MFSEKFVENQSFWRNVVLISLFEVYFVWILITKFHKIDIFELFTRDFRFSFSDVCGRRVFGRSRLLLFQILVDSFLGSDLYLFRNNFLFSFFAFSGFWVTFDEFHNEIWSCFFVLFSFFGVHVGQIF